MSRTCVVTGAASGIGAACVRRLRDQGHRVLTSDLRDADVIADLATTGGRVQLVEGVTRLSGGAIDAIIANAGGGPPETSTQLNYFGAVATLEGLRPLLAQSDAPRAVAVSSTSSLSPPHQDLADACLAGDEASATRIASRMLASASQLADAALGIYASSKLALNRWCRREAPGEPWAAAGVALNVVALGVYDTPAASYLLTNDDARTRLAAMTPLRGASPGHPDQAGTCFPG